MIFIKKYSFLINLIILAFYFQGCGNVDYRKVDKIQTKNSFLKINPLVEFNINEEFNFNSLNCVSIDKIIDKTNNKYFRNIDKKNLLRKSIYGVLSSKNFELKNLKRFDYLKDKNKELSSVNLLKKLNCDAIIKGEIIEFKNNDYITYSITSVGVYLELIHKNGDVLWSAQHFINSRDGNLPLDLISLLSGIYDASYNKKDEVIYQMIDTVIRRTISTLPDKEFDSKNSKSIYDNITNIVKVDDLIVKKDAKDFIENLLNDGKYEEAISFSYKEIGTKNDKSKYYYYLSKANFYLNNYDNAIKYSLIAISNGYFENNIYSILGISYLKTNELKLAGEAFNKGHKFDPNNSLNNYYNGIYYEITSNYTLAGKYYFKSGILSINEGNRLRLYRSLKKLKKLRNFNKEIKSYYLTLGEKTSVYLETLK